MASSGFGGSGTHLQWRHCDGPAGAWQDGGLPATSAPCADAEQTRRRRADPPATAVLRRYPHRRRPRPHRPRPDAPVPRRAQQPLPVHQQPPDSASVASEGGFRPHRPELPYADGAFPRAAVTNTSAHTSWQSSPRMAASNTAKTSSISSRSATLAITNASPSCSAPESITVSKSAQTPLHLRLAMKISGALPEAARQHLVEHRTREAVFLQDLRQQIDLFRGHRSKLSAVIRNTSYQSVPSFSI